MSPKEEPKAKDAAITVNIDDFTRTRDSVIISLAKLQSAVSDLSRAYINHTNTVLGRDVDIEGVTGGITSTLLESGLLGRLPSPGAKSDEKKKKKRAHDPNAPKRALTPFFLYMKSNRQQIAEELGPNTLPGDVNEEGLRRWHNMSAAQKAVWKNIYQDNLAVYRKKMEAYKAGLPVPEDDAKEKTQSPPPQQTAAARALSESETGSSSEEEEEEEEEKEPTPEPVREPTPPPRKRRRSEVKTPKEVVASPAISRKESSPEKKKRTVTRKDKEREEELASARKPANVESKRSKKKRKSDVAPAEE